MPDDLFTTLIQRENAQPLGDLREILDEPTYDDRSKLPNQVSLNLPLMGKINVPRPPQFQPEPQAIGTEAGNAVRTMLKLAPALQGRVNQVRVGPNDYLSDFFTALHQQDKERPLKNVDTSWMTPETFARGGTNTLGITGEGSTPPIALNPILYGLQPKKGFNIPYTLESVLGHELAHAAGHLHGEGPEDIERIILNAQGIKTKR